MNRSLGCFMLFLTVLTSFPVLSITPEVFAQEPDYLFSVNLLAPVSNPNRKATALILAQDLQKIGIDVHVIHPDSTEFDHRYLENGQWIPGYGYNMSAHADHDDGGFDMLLIGYIEYPGLIAFHEFYYSNEAYHGFYNSYPVINETLNELLDLAQYCRDLEQRTAYVHQMFDILAWDIMPETRLYDEIIPFYYRDNIQGVGTERPFGHLFFSLTLPTISEFYFIDGHSYGHGQTNELIYAIPSDPNGYMWSPNAIPWYFWKQGSVFPYANNWYSGLVLSNVMGSLLQFDSDSWHVPELLTKLPTPAPGVPNLFTGIPSTAEGCNATVWELELRDDIYWHEGYGYNMSAHADILKVDTDDVVFTYQYIFNNVQVVKIDNRHVQFHIKLWPFGNGRPWHWNFGPLLPKHILEEGTIRADGTVAPAFVNWTTDDWNLGNRTSPYTGPAVIGTGPYILEGEDSRQRTVTLRKNPYWFMNDDPRYSKRPEKVIFKIIPEPITAAIDLEIGAIDVMCSGLWDWDAIFNHPTIIKKPGIEFYPIRDWGGQYLQFNILNGANGKLVDPNVRLAIAHMCDRQAMVDRCYGGLGRPASFHTSQKNAFYPKDLEPIEYNLTRAIEYMERAGYNMDPYKSSPSEEVLHLEGISFVAIGVITCVVLVYVIKRSKR